MEVSKGVGVKRCFLRNGVVELPRNKDFGRINYKLMADFGEQKMAVFNIMAFKKEWGFFSYE